MVDHITKLDSLSESEKDDLENIARTIPDLIIYMLKMVSTIPMFENLTQKLM